MRQLAFSILLSLLVVPLVVLSHAMWQTHLGGRADVRGGTLQVGPTAYTSTASCCW